MHRAALDHLLRSRKHFARFGVLDVMQSARHHAQFLISELVLTLKAIATPFSALAVRKTYIMLKYMYYY